jgi:hypothetical protein
MELAGLEPATSWVRSRIRGFRARPRFPRIGLFAGLFSILDEVDIPAFHPSRCTAGLHMGCNRRCRNQQRLIYGVSGLEPEGVDCHPVEALDAVSAGWNQAKVTLMNLRFGRTAWPPKIPDHVYPGPSR